MDTGFTKSEAVAKFSVGVIPQFGDPSDPRNGVWTNGNFTPEDIELTQTPGGRPVWLNKKTGEIVDAFIPKFEY